jgi:hypothetical protein
MSRPFFIQGLLQASEVFGEPLCAKVAKTPRAPRGREEVAGIGERADRPGLARKFDFFLGALCDLAGLAHSSFRAVQRRFCIESEEFPWAMLRSVIATGKWVVVCTVYDAVPGLGAQELMALAAFNEVILREAFRAGIPVIDLRLVCDKPADYSHISPIEPSDIGGSKISHRIADIATGHDFSLTNSVIYR